MRNGQYLRYVALGDSQTEGVGDGDDTIGLRGFADRLAERIAVVSPEVRYANLAVRGRLAGQVRAEQLGPALALRPDVATVIAGVNDLLRPRFDPDETAAHVEAMFAALTAAGARVATVTIPDITRIAPIARPVAPRIAALNDRIRLAAARHDVALAETSPHAAATDPRFWATDRLHASPLGHDRISAALAHALGLPGSDDSWTQALAPSSSTTVGAMRTAATELRWAAGFLGPWLLRRLRGQSSGDGRAARRPELLPVGVPPVGI
ncbi:SGNH/GDSL hydrolase family protein [Streptomyces sp. NPDC057193]|uniref:SGNH/GDSL hydrolase family protein n=1 Tax=unclassified Streptomyces TaxID=2593676 RepID=UPI0009394089|nr:SGNH/GDSL hydrolase family protein [Streptomyces sp. CB02261]OKJ62546.1 lysophospholipase [Streptomyces sp. CB02261]